MNRPQLTINVTDFLTWINSHLGTGDAKFVGKVIRFASGRVKSVELVISRDNLRIIYKITQEFKKENHNTIGFLFGLILHTLQRYFDKDLKHVIGNSQYNMGSTAYSAWCTETMTSALKKFQIVMDIVSNPQKYVRCLSLRDLGHTNSEAMHWGSYRENSLYKIALYQDECSVSRTMSIFNDRSNSWYVPMANFVVVGA